MTTAPPRMTLREGISRKRKTAQTVENTGSSICSVETRAGDSYFSPQLKMLWPRKVQNSTMPQAQSQLMGSYPR